MTRWPWLGVLALVAACPAPEPPAAPIPPVSAGKVHVRVFTEPSPVRSIVALDDLVFVATDDAVERWDRSGNVLAISGDHGLPGSHVIAISADPEHQRLWILTDGGLGSYDTRTQVYTDSAPPPAALDLDFATVAKEGGATLASAAEGGAWLGTAHGLYFVSDRGGWVPTAIKDPVHALLRDRAGWLWIAAKSGLYTRKPGGDIVAVSATQGCQLAEPRLLADAPGERVVAIGADDQGHERIAIGKQLAWTSYRTLPEITWDSATRRGNAVVVIGGGRAYRIAAPDDTVRPLARDGLRLVPLAGGTASDWVIDPLELVLPAGATAVASAGDELLVGTRDLGTARFRDGDVAPRDWLRRKQMFEDATALSVACTRLDDCWLATGTHQAWHWNGERFLAGGPDQIVLAVARAADGAIYALHRAAAEHEIHLSRIVADTWTPIDGVALTTPGDAPEISFARVASTGMLWVGLRYHDAGERYPYGVAVIDPATAKVVYHRAGAPADPAHHSLPIPIDVVDADLRGGIAWFATNEGVARLAGDRVQLWTEADGLRSELARAVTIAPDGNVLVATGAGAGIWDGKVWAFPPALRFAVNDVAAAKNGQVWMATERGIAAWDGQKVRRVDARRGLAENQVLDVAIDQFDRVWARGPASLTLITE